MSYKLSYGIPDSESCRIICSARVGKWRDSIMSLIWHDRKGARMSAAVKWLFLVADSLSRQSDPLRTANNTAMQRALLHVLSFQVPVDIIADGTRHGVQRKRCISSGCFKIWIFCLLVPLFTVLADVTYCILNSLSNHFPTNRVVNRKSLTRQR